MQIEWQVYENETVAMLPCSMKYDSEIHILCINHHRSDSVNLVKIVHAEKMSIGKPF